MTEQIKFEIARQLSSSAWILLVWGKIYAFQTKMNIQISPFEVIHYFENHQVSGYKVCFHLVTSQIV